jgi:hypothetical protein
MPNNSAEKVPKCFQYPNDSGFYSPNANNVDINPTSTLSLV